MAKQMKKKTGRHGDAETRRKDQVLSVFASPRLRVRLTNPSSFILVLTLLASLFVLSSSAQRRNGAHSATPRDVFTAADKNAVERALGTACAERIRDPLGSMPI